MRDRATGGKILGWAASAERVATRLALYAMIWYGLTTAHSDPTERLVDRLHFLLGACALAVVAQVSRRSAAPPP